VDDKQRSFLTAVLGDGADALVKAVDRSPDLEFAIVPRAILAWLQSAPTHEGEVPGVPGTFVAFEKGEAGFSGRLGVGGSYRFDRQSLFHVAGAVAVEMDLDYSAAPEGLRDLDIERLGKSIDLLARVRAASGEAGLAKGEYERKYGGPLSVAAEDASNVASVREPPPAAHQLAYRAHTKAAEHHETQGSPTIAAMHRRSADYHRRIVQGVYKGELGKAQEEPGPAAGPIPPKSPTPPTPTAPKPGNVPQSKPPKVPTAKVPTIKLARSEADRPCPACGRVQFDGGSFVGCACFSALAKGVEVVSADPSGVSIRLDPSTWDASSALTFLESVGRGSR
jgi:hypothetical protein